MQDNWVLVYETPDRYILEVKRAHLESAGIPVKVMNDQVEMHTVLNTTLLVKLYTLAEYEKEAKALIESATA